MKAFDRSSRLALIAALAIAGCAHSGTLPSTVNPGMAPQLAQTNAEAIGTFEPARATPEAVGNSTPPCKVFPNICVDQGGSATLGIKVTCKRGGKPVKCGSVKWFTKTSNKGLTWSFKPNPGNPTTETIRASATIKVGKYSQAISAKCSNVPNCPKGYMAAIYVQK